MDPGLPGKLDMGVCTLSSLVIQMCVCEAPGLPGDLDVAVWTPGSLVIMDMGVGPREEHRGKLFAVFFSIG